jgi:hypothetical protein
VNKEVGVEYRFVQFILMHVVGLPYLLGVGTFFKVWNGDKVGHYHDNNSNTMF